MRYEELILKEFEKDFGEYPSLKFSVEGNTVKTVEIAQWDNVKKWVIDKVRIARKKERLKTIELLQNQKAKNIDSITEPFVKIALEARNDGLEETIVLLKGTDFRFYDK